jgi:hypothetical protein
VGPAFDALDRARDALAGLSAALEDVSPTDLAELAVGLHSVVTLAQSAHVRLVRAAVEREGLPPGPLGVRSWLRHSHRVSGREAGRVAAAGAWLRDHPRVAEAFGDGSLLFDHIDVMRRMSERTPRRREAFVEFQALLVTAARNADVDRFLGIMTAWCETVDAESADEDAKDAHERRRVFLSPLGDGWDLSGWLPALAGAELAGILNEFMERARREDQSLDSHPGKAAARADALLDLARAAAQSDLAVAARDRAKIISTVPIDRLTNLTGEQAEISRVGAHAPLAAFLAGLQDATSSWRTGNGPGTGLLTGSEARWLSCDGQVTRLVLGPESRPLDVGRSTRVIPPQLRTALDNRDKGCAIPGCDRPPGWCEAHHIQHWSDGGATSEANLILLCSRHHHELHLGHWSVEVHDDGNPWVRHTRQIRKRERHHPPHPQE